MSAISVHVDTHVHVDDFHLLPCSGGVTLTFGGCGTDVVQRPQLVVAASNSRRDTSPVSTVVLNEFVSFGWIVQILHFVYDVYTCRCIVYTSV